MRHLRSANRTLLAQVLGINALLVAVTVVAATTCCASSACAIASSSCATAIREELLEP